MLLHCFLWFYFFIGGCAASALLLRLVSSCGKWWLVSSPVGRLLIEGASLVVEPGPSGSWASVVAVARLQRQAPKLGHADLVALWQVGSFPDQESNPHLLLWQSESLPLSQQRSP